MRGPVTAAADVWGVAATLYYAAAGRPPFDRSRSNVRYRQLHEAPQPLPGSVDPELAELIHACLLADPDRRPAAAEVAARLEPLVDRLPQRALMGRLRVRPPR